MVELLKERLKIATGGKLKPTEVDPEEEERQFTEAYLALKGERPPPPIIPVFHRPLPKVIIIIITIIIIVINIIIIIINTRPKPAYGRQGLAGSWGQDTDEVSTFLVFLTSHFAPAALSSDLNQTQYIPVWCAPVLAVLASPGTVLVLLILISDR